eukprot:g22254.t1
MSSTSYIYFTPNRALFEEHRLQSIAELTEKIPFCIERDILSPNGTFYGDPLVLPLVNSRLKSAAIELDVYSSNVQCQDMREQCKRPDARLLRMVCGVTCGCTDPLASPWHKVKAQGCSDFWDGYGTAVSTYYGQDISKTAVWPFASNVSERLRMLGCQGLRVPQLQTELVSKARWCEGFPPLFRPLAWLCPNACGCASAFPDEAGHCPAHCAPQGSSGTLGPTASGSMRSAEKVRPGTLPTQVAAWSVRTGYDEWLLQDVEVRATAKAVEQGDELIAYHRDNELKALTAAGLHGKKGAWLYGDYKSLSAIVLHPTVVAFRSMFPEALNEVEGITTVVACAQACQADTNCYHWNFQVEKHRCDLKAENGGSNEDIADWVYGDVPRPSKKSDEI